MKKKKFLIGGLIIFLAIGYLGYTGFMSSAAYYYTVSEFVDNKASLDGETVRVNGLVAPGSVQQEDGGRTLRFTIVEGTDSLPVIYRGIVPDTFQPGGEAVVEGHLNSTGIFEASILMPKCASKYVAE